MSERTVSVRITGNAADFQAALEAAGVQAKVVADQIVDAFGTTFKAKLDAAFKSLPDLKINADSSDVDTKLAAIKGEMDDLRNKTIGVDLSDTDALAKIDDLRARLVVVAAESPDIRIKVDAADAIAKLDLVKKAADDASGKTDGSGLSGLTDKLGSSSGGLSSFGSSASDSLGPLASMGSYTAILATALVPLAGVAAAAGIGLAGMATAAGAALGAFGIAALPVYTKVSSALTQITADQLAVTRATSATTKNTAITHLQQDLSNLSPMVAQVTLGVINAKQAFSDWDAQFDPAILQVFSSAIADFKPLLDDMTPLVYAGAAALNKFFQSVGDVAKSADFKNFINFLAAQAGPAIAAISETVGNFGKAFGDALQKSGPLIKDVEKGLVGVSKSLLNWVDGGGFQSFLNWVQKNGPGIVKDVEEVAKAAGKLIVAITPIGERVLTVLGALGRLLSSPVAVWIENVITHMNVVSIAFEVFHAAVSLVEGTISELANFFTSTLPHAFDTAVNALHTAWSDVANWVSANVVQPIVGFFTGIPGAIDHIWSDVVNALHTAWSTVASWVNGNIIQPVVSFFTGLPGSVDHVWGDVVSALHSAWSDVANWVNTTFVQPIANFFTAIPGQVDHVWSDITSAIHSAWGDISSWVDSDIVQPVLRLFGDVIDGAADAFSWVPVVGGKLSAAKQAFDNFAAGVQQDLNSLHPPPPISISIDTSQAMSAIVNLGQAAATAAAQTQSAGVGFAALNLPHFAAGGIVTQRTLAIVGEAGPEMIIPLSNLATAAASTQGLSSIGAGPMIGGPGSGGNNGPVNLNLTLTLADGTKLATGLMPDILAALYQRKRAVGTLQLS